MPFRTLIICLALFASMPVLAQSDEAESDRFVIPPDAMSPLRRDGEKRPRAGRTEPVDVVPKVMRDLSALPVAVRRTHQKLIEAASAGELEELRGLLGSGDRTTQLTLDGLETDPIEFLLAGSGDPAGHEVLAILLEVLEAGFVRVQDEEDGDIYIWPYFAAYPVDKLTPRMKVELFRLLTGGDYEEMQEFGAYVFYRVGISADGEWRFFLQGDG